MKNEFNGVINILKPPGMTSFDVIAFLRRLTHQKRIGHSGTLDPEACGVLPTYFGNACGAIEFSSENEKVYIAELLIGVKSDTQDISGNITGVCRVPVHKQDFLLELSKFIGKIQQKPPMYSAVKVNGVKLCDAARKGREIERSFREIEIYNTKCISFKDDNLLINNKLISVKKAIIKICCSKGTYVRTICSDLGESLRTYACMSNLIRVKSGKFKIEDSLSLEEIEKSAECGTLVNLITHTESIFEDLNQIILNPEQEKKYMNGVAIEIQDMNFSDTNYLYRVYNSDKQFISLGRATLIEEVIKLKSKKFFL